MYAHTQLHPGGMIAVGCRDCAMDVLGDGMRTPNYTLAG
jgi:hypothetical protein